MNVHTLCIFRMSGLQAASVRPIFSYCVILCGICLQCFDAIGWSSGRASGLQKWWGAGMFVWSEVKMICVLSSWCHCHPITSCFVKIQLDLTFLVLAYPGCPRRDAIKRVNGSFVSHYVEELQKRRLINSKLKLVVIMSALQQMF